ncbi:MAG: bifunctional acetate--CoA ligase family protein/GNAT family N-acetyltransferase [Pirellulaceae bacterium]
MSTFHLNRIFRPESIVVVGASDREGNIGGIVVANLKRDGYEGRVVTVHPQQKRTLDCEVYSSIGAVDGPIDLAILCTPAETIPGLVQQCADANIHGVIVLSAGFRETGAEGRKLEQQLRDVLRVNPSVRLIGPNCLGIISTHHKLNASFAAGMPPSGRIAMISQSGALCTSLLDWAITESVGFSHFISIGNALNVTIADLIDYLSVDPYTDAIVLYVESIEESRSFMSAARAFCNNKPIVAYKSGRFKQSAAAAASHTGALAGVDEVYDAAFRRAGIVRVNELDELVDCAEILSRGILPSGSRLAVLTNAGGPGIMAVDALLSVRGTLATLSQTTVDQLNQVLPTQWSHANPIDVLGDAPPDRYSEALAITLRDPQIDAVLLILTPQAMTDPTETARQAIQRCRQSRKLVLAIWMGGESVVEGIRLFNDAGIPTFPSPEHGIRAFEYLMRYRRNQEVLHETPSVFDVRTDSSPAIVQQTINDSVRDHSATLAEDASKRILSAYGIPVAETLRAGSADEAVACAEQLRYPVVLKVLSPQISHKTDVGGVALHLRTEQEVRSAYEGLLRSARQHLPDAIITGVTVQPMIDTVGSHELILGAVRDPVFGPVLMLGAGGIAAEVLHDVVFELPPLNHQIARRMIETLKIWPLLSGYRQRHAVDLDSLVEVILRTSQMIADCPRIDQLDINPLLVSSRGCVALDARITLNHDAQEKPQRRFSHLAIRPYPDEYETTVVLKNGRQVLLRPIRPEDEPTWKAMLKSCSPETLWFRFRCTFAEATHEMASRFCFIDYDRELAMVAMEASESGERMIGVCRLIGDVDCQSAEYAVLVIDAYQGTGLGSALTDHSLNICRQWGVSKIIADTTQSNHRMLRLLRSRGFELKSGRDDSVIGVKHLSQA